MINSRLSLSLFGLTALALPCLAVAAPAATPSELFQRMNADTAPRTFTLDAGITSEGSTAGISIDGAGQGTGDDGIAHAMLTIEMSDGETSQWVDLRVILLNKTIYLKLSHAQGDISDTMERLQAVLGSEPWLALPLDEANGSAHDLATFLATSGAITPEESATLESVLLDAIFALTNEPVGGDTVYHLSLQPRLISNVLAAFSDAMSEMGDDSFLEMFGTDVGSDLELRRVEGWLKDNLVFEATVERDGNDNFVSSNLNGKLTIDDATWMTLTASAQASDESVDFLPPLRTITLEQFTAAVSGDEVLAPFFGVPYDETADWSGSWDNGVEPWMEEGYDQEWDGTDLEDWNHEDADTPVWNPLESCTLMELRRGECHIVQPSRRWLDQQ